MRFYKKSIIYRNDDQPYLIRHSLFSCRYFAIKVHNIRLSDHACLHDHPWAFITLLLKGGYVEHTEQGSKVYGRGTILYRPARFLHRLEIHQPVWTLVITFRKTRQWGFQTPKGWVFWRQYTATEGCE